MNGNFFSIPQKFLKTKLDSGKILRWWQILDMANLKNSFTTVADRHSGPLAAISIASPSLIAEVDVESKDADDPSDFDEESFMLSIVREVLIAAALLVESCSVVYEELLRFQG